MMIRTTLVVLSLFAMVASGSTDHTYVNNLSSRSIRATTDYALGHSQFVNRLIDPNHYDADEYTSEICDLSQYISLTLWVDGAANSNWVELDCDVSVVGLDNSDKSGVDIYESQYGDIDEPVDDVLITIYP